MHTPASSHPHAGARPAGFARLLAIAAAVSTGPAIAIRTAPTSSAPPAELAPTSFSVVPVVPQLNAASATSSTPRRIGRSVARVLQLADHARADAAHAAQ